MKKVITGFISLTFMLVFFHTATAQYFGRNKPVYEKIKFDVYQTPNFNIYNYVHNQEVLDQISLWAEQWYHEHQMVLQDTIKHRNPLLLYNNHADFQQTNAVGGRVGMGTGGVTEALKNRVIFPIAMSNQQTHHVLGHELVHAFQYNMIINGDSTNLQNLGNLPLWMVEGLAEYLSIGRMDTHTAMWMRDAVINDDVPTLKDLDNPKYFPYRYGQAFWAFVAGLVGDDMIRPLFIETSKVGLDEACLRVLGMTKEKLSELWVDSFKRYYGGFLRNQKKEHFIGKELFAGTNSGDMNIAPVLSPNGKYIIFLSEKSVFSLDLYIADAKNGKILKKVASSGKSSHIDDFNFMESSGTWSPDSKKFAFVAVSKGDNILVIKEALTGKTVRELAFDEIPAFSNPTWSPDGKSIVVSGLVNGQTDLYQINLKTGKTKRLTNDRYSELQPNWSPDGTKIVFASDRLTFGKETFWGKWTFNISILDMKSGTISDLDFFPTADSMNPIFNHDGDLLFISNRNGYSNLYKYETSTGDLYQLTDFVVGISGITHYAPAITTAVKSKRNRVVFTNFYDGKYTLYRARPKDFLHKKVSKDSVDLTASKLIRVNKQAPNLVDNGLKTMENSIDKDTLSFAVVPYAPNFKLDYIGGGAGVGVGTSTGLGQTTGGAGGVDLRFSDILGNNQVYTSLFLNGEIYDFGGMIAYLNRTGKIHWGGSISHFPYRSGRIKYKGIDTLQDATTHQKYLADHYQIDNIRTFENKAGIFAQYPLSTTFRLEAGVSYALYSNRIDRYDNFYNPYGRLIYQQREKIPVENSGYNLFKGNLANLNMAAVGDNAVFGMTAPLRGHRYRLGVQQYLGVFDFSALTADYRKYIFLKPFSLAFRAMHQGNYGGNSKEFYPNFLGYQWYLRGYSFNDANYLLPLNDMNISDIFGTKILVSNFEVRIPFTGPEKLALIKSGLLFTDLNFFVDGGVAFDEIEELNDTATRKPVFSAGVSLRINLFGALILEPYYARPLLKETKWVFGFNFVPGW